MLFGVLVPRANLLYNHCLALVGKIFPLCLCLHTKQMSWWLNIMNKWFDPIGVVVKKKFAYRSDGNKHFETRHIYSNVINQTYNVINVPLCVIIQSLSTYINELWLTKRRTTGWKVGPVWNKYEQVISVVHSLSSKCCYIFCLCFFCGVDIFCQ